MHPKAIKDKVLCPTAVPTPDYSGPLWPQCTQTLQIGGVWLLLHRRVLTGFYHSQSQLNNKYPHPQSDQQIKISVSPLDPVSCLSSTPGSVPSLPPPGRLHSDACR